MPFARPFFQSNAHARTCFSSDTPHRRASISTLSRHRNLFISPSAQPCDNLRMPPNTFIPLRSILHADVQRDKRNGTIRFASARLLRVIYAWMERSKACPSTPLIQRGHFLKSGTGYKRRAKQEGRIRACTRRCAACPFSGPFSISPCFSFPLSISRFLLFFLFRYHVRPILLSRCNISV
jgi:hypothetical protein